MADTPINDVGHFLEAIYTRFVLRDLIGKIVPGAFCLFGLSAALYGWSEARDWVEHRNAVEYVGLFAAGWLITISLQWMGEAIGLIHYGWAVPRRPFSKKVDAAALHEFIDARRTLNRFLQSADDDQKAVYERFVVIKEAAGNTATALTFTLVAATARYCYELLHHHRYSHHDSISHPVFLLCGAVAIFGLKRMYSEHRLRQREYAKLTAEDAKVLSLE